jgi:hypothetical protein
MLQYKDWFLLASTAIRHYCCLLPELLRTTVANWHSYVTLRLLSRVAIKRYRYWHMTLCGSTVTFAHVYGDLPRLPLATEATVDRSTRWLAPYLDLSTQLLMLCRLWRPM